MTLQTRCPYSTDLLDGSEAENAEHILPVALGAPRSFTVPAKASKNTEMNTLIDEPAIHDPYLRFMAATQGVGSRSGPVNVNLGGILKATGAAVTVSLSRDEVNFKIRNPVDRDGQTGEAIGIMGFGGDAQKLVDQFQRDSAKKGKVVIAGPSIQHPSEVGVSMGMDLHVVRRELVKIAYLMTVRVFGDDAITSESGRLYRAAMMAPTIEEMGAVGLLGQTFQAFAPGVPRPQHHQHALTCVNLNGHIMSSVTLFGWMNGMFVTPGDGFTAGFAEGEVVVIDAPTSKLFRYNYVDVIEDLLSTGMPRS